MEPQYRRPDKSVATTLPTGLSYPQPGTAESWANIGWQNFFSDLRLKQVIALALETNKDLQIAVANMESSRAQYRIQRASLMPEVDAQANATYGSSSANATSSGGVVGVHVNERQYSLSLGVSSYELDLWGRIRSLNKKALEKYLAVEETARATQISLISDTASAWLTLAADQSTLEVARVTLASAQDSVQLTERRMRAGIATELDVQQAQTIAAQARSQIGQSITLVAQDENALRLLVGAPLSPELLPGALDDRVANREDLPADLSSIVLYRRPDVLSAEHALRAANFDIGAARAAFFPTITLTGSGGVSSTELASFFSGGSANWSFAPTISLPLFDGGKRRAQLDESTAEKSVQVATYEKTVQTAFREVADTLAQRGTINEQIAANASVVAAAQHSLELSNKRYSMGVADYLDVLDAQRTLFSARQSLVSIRLTRAKNLVTLYQTLGGGIE